MKNLKLNLLEKKEMDTVRGGRRQGGDIPTCSCSQNSVQAYAEAFHKDHPEDIVVLPPVIITADTTSVKK